MTTTKRKTLTEAEADAAYEAECQALDRAEGRSAPKVTKGLMEQTSAFEQVRQRRVTGRRALSIRPEDTTRPDRRF